MAIGKWIDYKVMVTKSLVKKLAIIACSNSNYISHTLKYFSRMMEENLWRFSSLSLVLALRLITHLFLKVEESQGNDFR